MMRLWRCSSITENYLPWKTFKTFEQRLGMMRWSKLPLVIIHTMIYNVI